MWQYVRTHLEQEEQWLPFLHQVFLHWDGAGLRLCAPERAIAWALANRQPRLQTLLQRYTGRSLTIEVPQEPLPHPRE